MEMADDSNSAELPSDDEDGRKAADDDESKGADRDDGDEASNSGRKKKDIMIRGLTCECCLTTDRVRACLLIILTFYWSWHISYSIMFEYLFKRTNYQCKHFEN